MKLLLGFVAACLLLLGALGWLFWRELPPPTPRMSVTARSQTPPRPAEAVAEHGRGTGYGEIAAGEAAGPLAGVNVPANNASPAATRPEPAVSALELSPDAPDDAASSTVRWASAPEDRAARRALDLALETLRTDPGHPVALRDAINALVHLGQWSAAADAIALLRRQQAPSASALGMAENAPASAIDGPPGQQTHAAADPAEDLKLAFEQATCLIRARRWFDAVHVLRAVVEQSPEHHQAWFNLAVAEQALGHLADARTAWDRAVALAPDDAAARAGRGEVLLDLREWDAAAADFRVAVQAQPATPAAAEARWNLSLALWKGGHVTEARAELVALVDQQPRHLPALNRLAEIEWESCRQSTADSDGACQQTMEWCRRSLAVNAAQPEVEHLLRQAQDRMPALK